MTSLLANIFCLKNLDLLILKSLVGLILTGTLIYVDFFYIETSSAFYLYILTVALLSLYSGLLLLRKDKLEGVFTKPIIITGCWSIYIYIHGYINHTINQVQIYFIAHFLFLLTIIIIFNNTKLNIRSIFQFLLLLSLLESILSITQYIGLISSKSSFFNVTGSSSNPNVTAMFIAMCLPAIFVFIKDYPNKKYISYCLLGIAFSALILLKCRSAIIGGLFGLTLFFVLKFNVANWIKTKQNRKASIILVIIGLATAFVVGKKIYLAKKASADGRKLIWKISGEMICEKPLSGHGYGLFEREYNLFQARYISEGRASLIELENAGHIKMAYNEFLHQAVEGGLPGTLLFLMLLLSLLSNPYKTKSLSLKSKDYPQHIRNNPDKGDFNLTADYFNAAYAGVGIFCCMAIFNFTFYAIPVMAVFFLYTAILSYSFTLRTSKKTFIFQIKHFSIITKAILIIGGTGLLYTQSISALAHRKNKVAANLLKNGYPEKATSILSNLEKELSKSIDYWINYANVSITLKNYEKALACLEKAKLLSSTPILFELSGLSYNKLKKYDSAISQYQKAIFFEPSRFKSRYQIMNNAIKAGDKKKAIAAAQQIIALKPKKNSQSVIRYKKKAKEIISYYE